MATRLRLLRDLYLVAAPKQRQRVLDCLLAFCDVLSSVIVPAAEGVEVSLALAG